MTTNFNYIPYLMNIPNKIDIWLDEKVNDKYIDNKYYTTNYTLKPYTSHYDFNTYYKDNDMDINASNKKLYDCITNSSKNDLEDNDFIYNLSLYIDHLLINPNTNRNHANTLFRQLIDYSFDNNFDYNLFNYNSNEYELINLMDVSMKKSFYKFCYDYSFKNNILYPIKKYGLTHLNNDNFSYIKNINLPDENILDDVNINAKSNITDDQWKSINYIEYMEDVFSNMENNIHELWNNVIVPYLENTNEKQIISKLNPDDYSKFFEYMIHNNETVIFVLEVLHT
jgi:hypothetical protein